MPDDPQLNQPLDRANLGPLSRRDWILGRAGPGEMAILLDDERMSVAGTANNPCTMAIRSALGIWVEDETGRRYRIFTATIPITSTIASTSRAGAAGTA